MSVFYTMFRCTCFSDSHAIAKISHLKQVKNKITKFCDIRLKYTNCFSTSNDTANVGKCFKCFQIDLSMLYTQKNLALDLLSGPEIRDINNTKYI